MRIAVTGGTGKLGRSVVSRLRDEGHDVVNLDRVGTRGSVVLVDLTDYGQVADALQGIDEHHSGLDAVVHLGAIPAPGILPDAATFHHNMLATYNVFQAARRAGINRIVYASSETVLGLPFETPPPYIPVDEEYPARPESTYSLVKHLEEQMAIQLTRWDPRAEHHRAALLQRHGPRGLRRVPRSYHDDARLRRWNLWGYIDARDGAQAVVRALENAGPGFETFIIAAADTVMTRPSNDLAAEVFPDVELRPVDGHTTLLSIDKARRLLGYAPEHSWRDHVPAGGSQPG